MRILAIETSCDETAIALVEASGGLRQPNFKILKNVVSSQVKIHRPFGGVVPSLAKREHLKNLPVVLQKTLSSNLYGHIDLTIKHRVKRINLIAVTVGPGLEPALWTGINFAKALSADLRRQSRRPTRKIPALIGVNHLEGHMYSFLLAKKAGPPTGGSSIYPAIVLIVSGGHTILIHQKSLTSWKKIGETRDDAAGEAFDKIARLLGLPYPGGPELEKLALTGDARAIEFPRPMIHQKNFDFSFSGLKTAVLYYVRDSKLRIHPNLQSNKEGMIFVDSHKFVGWDRANVAASAQEAIIDVLVGKTMRAATEIGVRSVILSGGVASNNALRKRLRGECRKSRLNFLSAPRKYQTDNGAMIAVAAYINHLQDKKRRIIAQASLNL